MRLLSEDGARLLAGGTDLLGCLRAEAILSGNRLNREIVSKAVQAALAAAEPLPQNEYKIPLFSGLIEQALLAYA